MAGSSPLTDLSSLASSLRDSSSSPDHSPSPTPSQSPVPSQSPTSSPSSELSTLSDISSLVSSPAEKVDLYEIDTLIPENVRMVAAVDLQRGCRILAEKPLFTYQISPAETYNPSTFYKPKGPHNCLDALERAIDRLPLSKQTALGALMSPPGTARAEKVRYNAFEEINLIEGKQELTLRVYDHLSRINHSCRPNATVEWNSNPRVEAGTLHALTDITEGEEILISYLPKPEDCLKTMGARNTVLRTSYRFSCGCASCIQGMGENGSRKEAYTRYESATAPTETTDEEIVTKIAHWTRYIQLLNDLELFDTKLSEAHDAVSNLHYMRASAADRLQDVRIHCTACNDTSSSASHLESSLAAFTEALRVDLYCLGRDNPQTLARRKKLFGLYSKLQKYS